MTTHRDLFRQLASIGWERMTPAFAIPYGGEAADHFGTPVPPTTTFSTRTTARSASGPREFTLRTLDTDFELVGRLRLRRAGLNQKIYSFGPALYEGSIRPDVLLAEGWLRQRDSNAAPLLDILGRHFMSLTHRSEQISASLVRLRVAAWEARDAG